MQSREAQQHTPSPYRQSRTGVHYTPPLPFFSFLFVTCLSWTVSRCKLSSISPLFDMAIMRHFFEIKLLGFQPYLEPNPIPAFPCSRLQAVFRTLRPRPIFPLVSSCNIVGFYMLVWPHQDAPPRRTQLQSSRLQLCPHVIRKV